MGYRPIQAFVQSFSSYVTFTSAIDFGKESYEHFQVRIPTLTTAADVRFWGSNDNSTFSKIYGSVSSGVVAPAAVQVGSAMTGCWVDVPGIHQRYVKMEFTSLVSDGSGFFTVVVA